MAQLAHLSFAPTVCEARPGADVLRRVDAYMTRSVLDVMWPRSPGPLNPFIVAPSADARRPPPLLSFFLLLRPVVGPSSSEPTRRSLQALLAG